MDTQSDGNRNRDSVKGSDDGRYTIVTVILLLLPPPPSLIPRLLPKLITDTSANTDSHSHCQTCSHSRRCSCSHGHACSDACSAGTVTGVFLCRHQRWHQCKLQWQSGALCPQIIRQLRDPMPPVEEEGGRQGLGGQVEVGSSLGEVMQGTGMVYEVLAYSTQFMTTY